jgi:type IV pilus assembly protein PilX
MEISSPARFHRQDGAALMVALIMLILITLIGVSAAQMQTMEVRMAANMHNRNLALQSAESALRTAEDGLSQANYSSAQFSADTAGLYLYTPQSGAGAPWYLGGSVGSSFWTTSSDVASGPVESTDSAQASSFIIEQLPPVARPGDALSTRQYGNDPHAVVYRITAQATGADSTSTITLQSIYH